MGPVFTGLRSPALRTAWTGVLCVLAASSLLACAVNPGSTLPPNPIETPIPTFAGAPTVESTTTIEATGKSVPTATRTPTATPPNTAAVARAPALKATGAGPPTPTHIPVPTATRTPMPEPAPTAPPTHTPTPSPTPTPTPTIKELAAAHLSEIIPWLEGPPRDDYSDVAELLVDLWVRDRDFGASVAGLPWVADRVDEEEARVLYRLRDIAATDPELGKRIVGYPWFADRITQGQRGNLHAYVLISLSRLAASGSDVVGQVTARPWFADGLDREEAAFLVALGHVARRSPTLYQDLLQAHFTQNRTVSLPLVGDVNIWVFQNAPFPPEEDLVTVIEDTARISESLLGAPFPTNEIILLVVDRSEKHYSIDPGHFYTNMRLIRSSGKVWRLPHETAHYYFFAPITGPRWLTEGAAEFIAAYSDDRTGVKELAGTRANTSRLARHCVDVQQMENIRHLSSVLANGWEVSQAKGCVYQMGENFLHSASAVMGEEAMMAALGELYLSDLGREPQNVEERIYEVLLTHVPVDRQEEFRELYQELHGGAAAFTDTDFADDHGDEADTATDVSVGQVVSGRLDYMFDFDYFRFRAEEGQKYRIDVNHETLRPTSVGLYAPNGLTGVNRHWKSRELVSTGPRIVWTAPSSEEFYLAVHNFGGEIGPYTLAIAPVDRSVQDDYGDTTATAIEILVGQTVEGTVNNDLDIDYFRFKVETGQKYGLQIVRGTLEEFSLRLRLPDGSSYRFDATTYRSWSDPFQWTAKSSGEASLAIDGVYGTVGTYTLKIVVVDNEPGD